MIDAKNDPEIYFAPMSQVENDLENKKGSMWLPREKWKNYRHDLDQFRKEIVPFDDLSTTTKPTKRKRRKKRKRNKVTTKIQSQKNEPQGRQGPLVNIMHN